jgi:hypothetical protein
MLEKKCAGDRIIQTELGPLPESMCAVDGPAGGKYVPSDVLDDSTLDRIIDAVGLNADQLDRHVLRLDILNSCARYGIRSDIANSDFAKRQINRLNSICLHLKRLAELYKDDDADMGTTQSWRSVEPEQLLREAELIESIKERTEKPAAIADRVKAQLGASHSALQWLTGELLPAVFTKHFHRPAKISRDPNAGGALGGPYVRFARQVLIELGVKCSDETIAVALRRAKLQANQARLQFRPATR